MTKEFRVKFLKEEEDVVWEFFLSKLRRRETAARSFDKSLWVELTRKDENCRHTATTLGNHFKRHMLSKLAEANIDDEDIKLILEICNVKLSDKSQILKLKNRMKCEIRLDNSGYVRLSTYPFIQHMSSPGRKLVLQKSANLNTQSQENTSESFVRPSTSRAFMSKNTAIVSPIKRSPKIVDEDANIHFNSYTKEILSTTSQINDRPSSSRAYATVMTRLHESDLSRKRLSAEEQKEDAKRRRSLDVDLNESSADVEFNLDGVALTEEQRADIAVYNQLCQQPCFFRTEQEEDCHYRGMLHLRARLISQRVLPADEFLRDVPPRINEVLAVFARTLELSASADIVKRSSIS